jgi:hypothetical protein
VGGVSSFPAHPLLVKVSPELTTPMSRWSAQPDAEQNGVAPLHALLQLKQLVAVPSCVVHPAAELLQSFQPASHVGWHAAPLQLDPPLACAV